MLEGIWALLLLLASALLPNGKTQNNKAFGRSWSDSDDQAMPAMGRRDTAWFSSPNPHILSLKYSVLVC